MNSHECTRVTSEIQRGLVIAIVDAAVRVREQGCSLPMELRGGIANHLDRLAAQAENIDYSMRWSELTGTLACYASILQIWHPELSSDVEDLSSTAYELALATVTP